MKNIIKKIIKEEINDFGWTKGVEPKYNRCSHFSGEDKELCLKIDTLKTFLVYDLGLKNIIEGLLNTIKEVKDINDEYQEPLELLYNTGQYPDIKFVDGRYTHTRLMNTGIVRDEKGEYHYVNKLNTNYSDLAELITQLFVKGGKVSELNSKNIDGLKAYLLSIKPSMKRLVEKYFKADELKEFVINTKYFTYLGDDAENKVLEVLEKFGMTKLYQGSNGDFIDMLFGIDLIMEYNGKTYTIQVKSKENALYSAMKNSYYSRINYFAAPTTNGGIVIINKSGKKTYLDFNDSVIE